jgi:heme/copper-type cytochrome/quinol oxidase subunit 4
LLAIAQIGVTCLLPPLHHRSRQLQQRAGVAFGVLIVMRLIVASLWIMINEVALPRRH